MNVLSATMKLAVFSFMLSSWTLNCSDSVETLVLQREWTANAEYAGDIWASKLAREKGFHLVVHEGSELLDPVRLVRSGDVQFGVASADRILQENEGGARLVIIASATFKTPVVFLSKKGSGIKTPQDFINKIVGIQAGTNTELVFKALVSATNIIEEERIRVVESGWGIQTFVNGDIDVLGAFDYDEPVQLEFRGIEYNVISPEDYGVDYVGTVYFTREDFIDNNPRVVQDVLNCLVLGWHRALQNPEKALNLLVEYSSEINADKEKRSLMRGKEYFQGENQWPLYSSDDRWESMSRSLMSLGRLRTFDYRNNIDYSYLQIALAELKKNYDD